MALHNFKRPDLPYDNVPLPNDNRFAVTTNQKEPIPVAMLEGENNYLIDSLNQLDVDINNAVAGNIPGSDDPNNAGKFLTTDGNSTLSFIAVSGNTFPDGTIPGVKIANQSITIQQMGNASVGADQIQNFSINASKIFDRTITALQIKSRTILALNIARQAITNEEIADNAITALQIANKAITAAQIADNTITALQIANSTITAAKIAAKTITAAQIADNTITAAQIADNTITFNQISNSFAATKSQQQAASSSSVFVSPAKQQDHPSACKVWVTFDGTTGAIQAGYNVSSVTVNSAANYTINFTNSFATANYATLITTESALNANGTLGRVLSSTPPTSSKVTIIVVDPGFGTPSIPQYVNVAIFGGQ